MSRLATSARITAEVIEFSLKQHMARGYSAMFLRTAGKCIHSAERVTIPMATSDVSYVTVRKGMWIDTYMTFTKHGSQRTANIELRHHINQNTTEVIIDRSADVNWAITLAQVLGYIVKVETTLDVLGQPIMHDSYGHSSLEKEGTHWDSARNATGNLRAGTSN
jgi:hypothetical protein